MGENHKATIKIGSKESRRLRSKHKERGRLLKFRENTLKSNGLFIKQLSTINWRTSSTQRITEFQEPGIPHKFSSIYCRNTPLEHNIQALKSLSKPLTSHNHITGHHCSGKKPAPTHQNSQTPALLARALTSHEHALNEAHVEGTTSLRAGKVTRQQLCSKMMKYQQTKNQEIAHINKEGRVGNLKEFHY